MRIPVERSAVAVIRAWTEGGHGGRLRIRISVVDDLSTNVPRTLATASADEASTILREWLEAVADGRPTSSRGVHRVAGAVHEP